jgi:hypothetical protein
LRFSYWVLLVMTENTQRCKNRGKGAKTGGTEIVLKHPKRVFWTFIGGVPQYGRDGASTLQRSRWYTQISIFSG